MALFENPHAPELYKGVVGKTHTNLVVSEGAAPAERFIVSSKHDNSRNFIYEYGPEGNQTVLIAKGKIVEAVGEEMDREFGHKSTAIKIAAENSERAIGVNQHNVYDQRRDAMEGNRPTVLTRNYIEVPLFEHATTIGTAADTAKAMHFGAAYGLKDQLRSGDFVVAGIDGNFKQYVKGTHDFTQVIGQVLNVNRELPPSGLLQYYTGLKSTALEEYMKQLSTTPVAGDAGYPYGSPYTVGSWRPEFLKSLGLNQNTGIPFLTDGYFSARQTIDAKFTDATTVEKVRAGEGVTITGDNAVVNGTVLDAMVIVKLKHKIDPRAFDQIKVTYDKGELNETTTGDLTDKIRYQVPVRDVHVDVTNNTVVIYAGTGAVMNNVEISIASVVNPTAGIPTEWDYKGSVGAARILLLR